MGIGDKSLTCRNCGTQFVFTAGEQKFYAQRGFTNEPTRCPGCRGAKKGGSIDNQRTPKICFRCGGAKMIPCTMPTCVGGHIACFRCQGTGQQVYTYAGGMKMVVKECPRCVGNGYPWGRLPCERCRMAGYLTCRKCNGKGILG